jgi:hypothetical protein
MEINYLIYEIIPQIFKKFKYHQLFYLNIFVFIVIFHFFLVYFIKAIQI